MTFSNAISVDVEEYFQVSAFEKHISRDSWSTLPSRVEGSMDRILEIFDQGNVKCTFFVLGWIAERFPALIRRIAESGHEVASHGYCHIRVTQQDPAEFLNDASTTKKMLEDIAGTQVKGYRAASYSINRSNLWAFKQIEAAGYSYSSSVYPIRHDLYGIPDAPRFPFRPEGTNIMEIPITSVAIAGCRLPAGGGGYFRLFPYRLSRALLRRVNNKDGRACVFYFHPWELDPSQPRQQGVSLKTRVRHYTNLAHMESRLLRLLNDFQWDRIDRVFVESATLDSVPTWSAGDLATRPA